MSVPCARVTGASLVAALAVGSLLGHAAEPTRLRVAHPNGPAHHMGRTITAFAEDVKTRTNGAIVVEQQGENGRPATAFEAVKTGQVEGAGIANFYWPTDGIQGLGGPIPEMNVTLLPYRLTDINTLKRFPRSEAAKLLEAKVAAKGVHPLMWIFITNTNLFSSVKAPLVNPGDFKGLRIRSLGGISEDMFRTLGAEPAPMPPAEVAQWIRDGKGDGGTTDVVAAAGGKWGETQRYGTVAPVYAVFYLIFVNDAWWRARTPAEQRAIEAAAATAEQMAFTLAERASADAVDTLRSGGMSIHVQTPAERAAWEAALIAPLTRTFLSLSPDCAKVLALVEKL